MSDPRFDDQPYFNIKHTVERFEEDDAGKKPPPPTGGEVWLGFWSGIFFAVFVVIVIAIASHH